MWGGWHRIAMSTATTSKSGHLRPCVISAYYHTPQPSFQNLPWGHLGEWTTPSSAEEMLNGQCQRVDVPARARTAHDGLPLKWQEEGLCWIMPGVPLPSPHHHPIGRGVDLTWPTKDRKTIELQYDFLPKPSWVQTLILVQSDELYKKRETLILWISLFWIK